jgi:hypothetical protein
VLFVDVVSTTSHDIAAPHRRLWCARPRADRLVDADGGRPGVDGMDFEYLIAIAATDRNVPSVVQNVLYRCAVGGVSFSSSAAHYSMAANKKNLARGPSNA